MQVQVTPDQPSSMDRDRFPFRVFIGRDPVAAFATAEDADRFVAWCEDAVIS